MLLRSYVRYFWLMMLFASGSTSINCANLIRNELLKLGYKSNIKLIAFASNTTIWKENIKKAGYESTVALRTLDLAKELLRVANYSRDDLTFIYEDMSNRFSREDCRFIAELIEQ